ncbi:MAG: class I mannose-6-phosphate isomerase [Planctomycetes bacterium]|nr:class I mannose-6-phosphate isomerase [Planctomycetota bacterium]
MSFRKTTQDLLPSKRPSPPDGAYDLYPAFPAAGEIYPGFGYLARALARHRHAVIDGYAGVLWSDFRQGLDAALKALGVEAEWVCIDDALLPEHEIERHVAPYLGGDDPIFGMRFDGELCAFFDAARLKALRPGGAKLSICYGCGAALCNVEVWAGPLVYLDVPKNEIQFRARAGSVANVGMHKATDPKPAYKRSYFVDWPALNAHKRALLPRIGYFVDAQRPSEPSSMVGADLRATLERMAHAPFRPRPWFEPGPWGGQWLKKKVPQLPQGAANYAWSFELIAPENGLLVEHQSRLLECSFDLLMFHAHEAVLGTAAARFGFDFPIRFDYLDTVEGGNLSVQCHPRPEFIRSNFGEPFTQDETYYILDCKPGAQVYLGFREGVDPQAFRAALEKSYREAVPLDAERFVNVEPAHKHYLFLIPNGTIHCSGAGNVVLEISATPYIFTFKMYDWQRLDLDGRPRPLNIARAMDNLCFGRQGPKVRAELVSVPREIARGDGWKRIRLPTHRAHFYDVERYEFITAVDVRSEDACHVLNVVEGGPVRVETSAGAGLRVNYAETFVVPAAAGSYRLVNTGLGEAKVIKAFVKPECARPC